MPAETPDEVPILDLLNALTSAQEILDDPAGRGVRKLAGQIIEDCRHGTEFDSVRELAEQIRATSSRDERALAAERIAALLEQKLSDRTERNPDEK